jgi:hypothetical protein
LVSEFPHHSIIAHISFIYILGFRVSEHLEASFIRVEPARVSVIQWGTPFSGKFRSTEIERELGDSGTWVILTIARSIF